MLTVHGQQHSFSTHEQMFLWKCQSFWDRKCLDLRGTRTPNLLLTYCDIHDDVIKWKHFPRCWPFYGGIHWSLVNSPHKGKWHRALMFSLICVCINGWVNNFMAGDLRCNCAHYDVIVMSSMHEPATSNCDVLSYDKGSGQWFKEFVKDTSVPSFSSFITERMCAVVNCFASDVIINWPRATRMA